MWNISPSHRGKCLRCPQMLWGRNERKRDCAAIVCCWGKFGPYSSQSAGVLFNEKGFLCGFSENAWKIMALKLAQNRYRYLDTCLCQQQQ